MRRITNLPTMVAVFGAAAVAVGCTTRVADFNAISTREIQTRGLNIDALPKVENVEGEDITFLGAGADLQDAVDRALEKGHGNLMINAVVYVENRLLVSGFRVRGTVVQVPGASSAAPQTLPADSTK